MSPEQELTKLSNAKLLALLRHYNPFGGYSVGPRQGQLTRKQAIEVLLRYQMDDKTA